MTVDEHRPGVENAQSGFLDDQLLWEFGYPTDKGVDLAAGEDGQCILFDKCGGPLHMVSAQGIVYRFGRRVVIMEPFAGAKIELGQGIRLGLQKPLLKEVGEKLMITKQ